MPPPYFFIGRGVRMAFKRGGDCNRCGKCCDLACPHFYWIATKDIKAGQEITFTGLGQSLMAGCRLEGKPEKALAYDGACAGFPFDPGQSKIYCGYTWSTVADTTADGVYWPPKITTIIPKSLNPKSEGG